MLNTFTANCVTDAPKDDVLAIALSVFAHEYEIQSASARRFGTVVAIRITFKTEDDVVRLARQAAEVLLHQWPTDSVRLNGRTPKYHGRGDTVLDSMVQAAQDSGHLMIVQVD